MVARYHGLSPVAKLNGASGAGGTTPASIRVHLWFRSDGASLRCGSVGPAFVAEPTPGRRSLGCFGGVGSAEWAASPSQDLSASFASLWFALYELLTLNPELRTLLI